MTVHQLGKRAARFDRRTLQFSKYFKALPIPPANFNFTRKVSSWPIFGNDTLGDCVEAAQGHCIQQWTAYAKPPAVVLAESDIIAAYSAEGGYVPGDPASDQGTNMLTALNYWRNSGIAGHQILAYAALEQGNIQELEAAAYLFGNAFIGIQLPISAQGKNSWVVPPEGPHGNGAPGSWGGHCIPVCGIDPNGTTVVTWGQTLEMSKPFYETYSDEAYAVLSSDWLESNNYAPSHFDVAQLQADLKLL